MATTLLQQIETWTSDLEALQNRFALTPSQETDEQEELRVTIETLQAGRSTHLENHAHLPPPVRRINKTQPRVVELVSHGLFLTTPNGIIRETNVAGESMLDLSGRCLVGQPMLVFVDTEDRRAFLQKLVHFKHHPLILQVEWHLTLQSVYRQTFPAVINVSKKFDRTGKLSELTWLFRPHRYDLPVS